MEYGAKERAEFKREYAARQSRQIIVAIIVLALLTLMVFARGKELFLGLPVSVLMPASAILAAIAVGYSVLTWRCPACRAYLGRAVNQRRCRKCGVELM